MLPSMYSNIIIEIIFNTIIYKMMNSNSNILFYLILTGLLCFYYQKSITEFIENHRDGENVKSTFEVFYGHNKKLDDVIGNEEAKDEINKILDMIKNPKKYLDIGATIPKGVLLDGPPGTGKTLMVKAIAKESKLPLINTTGSSFCEMYVGVGASRIKKLFKLARKLAPCIIFIDEIDAVGRSRSKDISGGDAERASTLNQLLAEIDGFSESPGIIVIGATNRKKLLDAALLRSGRFDKHIHFVLPDYTDRIDLFKYYLGNKKTNMNIEDISDKYSKLCVGMSGADISTICNDASINAVIKDKKFIEKDDIVESYEDKLLGAKKKKDKLSIKEKKIISYHEAGHCFLQYNLKYVNEPNTVSIEPRIKTALGFSQSLPTDRVLNSKQEIIHEIAICLGGRLVEDKLNTNLVTTGAADDLRKVKNLAMRYVSMFGFDDKIGSFVSIDNNGGYLKDSDISDHMKYSMEERCIELINKIEKEAKKIIHDNYEKVQDLADTLLEKKRLFQDDINKLLGPSLKQSKVITI
jgi:ATP-dependent metalloprotease FtsH